MSYRSRLRAVQAEQERAEETYTDEEWAGLLDDGHFARLQSEWVKNNALQISEIFDEPPDYWPDCVKSMRAKMYAWMRGNTNIAVNESEFARQTAATLEIDPD